MNPVDELLGKIIADATLSDDEFKLRFDDGRELHLKIVDGKLMPVTKATFSQSVVDAHRAWIDERWSDAFNRKHPFLDGGGK